MDLCVLAVRDCPHVAVLLQRLRRALPDAQPPVPVYVITNESEAARFGMHGSPTLLVNGTDPFAAPDSVTSVSCRIYRVAEGRTDGAPSVEQLQIVLQRG